MGINRDRGNFLLSPTGKALLGLLFSLAVLGTGMFWVWQNILIPFWEKPPRPNFETIAPTRSP